MNGDIISQIAAKDQERTGGYASLLDFYNGKQWNGRERWGEKRLTFNYARVFIDKATSYLMSGINFTVEAVEDTPEARATAEEAEKVLAEVYEANNLMQLDLETETDCAILGDGCYKVTWEDGVNSFQSSVNSSGKGDRGKARGRVRVTAPDVQGIQAWWVGDDMARIWRVSSKYQLSQEEVEMLYGENPSVSPFAKGRRPTGEFGNPSQSPFSEGRGTGSETGTINASRLKIYEGRGPGTRTVVEVWTDAEFELYLDGTLIEKKANPYGFIPFVIFPNLREPKKFWGTSDLAAIMEPQKELNRSMSQVCNVIEVSGNPITVLENVDESADIAVKPGAVWNIPEDAKAYVLDLLHGGGLQAYLDYIKVLQAMLHDIAETPPEAFGGVSSPLSGVALEIALNPLQQKIKRKQTIRTPAYNRRNWMILYMIARFEKKITNKITEISGEKGKTTGKITEIDRAKGKIREISPDKFRMKVVWGAILPQDKDKLVANEQILVQNGIHSRRRAMDEVGVKDPEAEFRHWKEEQKEIGQL